MEADLAPRYAAALVSAPPLRLAARADLAPLARLAPASEVAPEKLEALQAWNQAGHRPTQAGFVRPLTVPQVVELKVGAAPVQPAAYAGGLVQRLGRGRQVWGGSVTVEEASRLRLHLDQVHLPPSARLWVYGGGESAGPFGLELAGPEGDLWTPSVPGPTLRLEVELPAVGEEATPWGFVLDRVAEAVAASQLGLPVGDLGQFEDTSCLVDGRCITATTLPFIAAYRRAVAQLTFVVDGDLFVCTGGLLNDTDPTSVIPYLLTANHCFSTQASAASLEAFWDFTTATCDGPPPAMGSLPRSNGATLLGSSVQTDFTLVRLASLPSNRAFLGWTPNLGAVGPGTVLHRLSHPFPFSVLDPLPQSYSQTRVSSSPFFCGGPDEDGRPLDNASLFLKADPVIGGTFGGSSGAPVILASGQVVGQLFGACGPGSGDGGCAGSQTEVDGAFAGTFPLVKAFLDPPVHDTTPCAQNSETLCLQGDGYEVQVFWQAPGGESGRGQAVELTEDTGYFWFFNSANVEMIIKVLDACSFADHIWVFAGGLTNVEVDITVRQVSSGETRTYHNPQGAAFQPIQDTQAFSICP